MKGSNVETFFTYINEMAEVVQNERELPYLESLVFTGEVIFQGEMEQILSDIAHKKIRTCLEAIDLEKLTKEQIRKTYQLAILKGMKEATQPHHAMTPDAVCLFMSYLVNKLTEKKEIFQLLDPAVGTGNMITAILNGASKSISSYGIEPDETLLKLAYVNANLQQHQIELFHQDSLTDIFIDPVDIIVSDLPVGHYPNVEVAKRYQLQSDSGMPYVHYLMVEQALNYTKPGGFLLLLIPNFMFETEQAQDLHKLLKDQAHIYSLLQLPRSMFKDEKYGKSIFIIRKKGSVGKQPQQALLAELPSFSNKQALSEMILSLNNWFDVYINE